ncbi:hypothetical protein ASG12_02655 [Williamsia sp. Leaf354]|uniref:hypothetical protein n=1 Tax=Williamsia sp. Leaf354 TaxID=1736349 RepID=UPI000700BB0B|nr:hypothetical protein [Williamsia sp. Leaf354]KQR99708.1 hypothetical protein ASG12_02655 [Williamsia sp. Leaf354]
MTSISKSRTAATAVALTTVAAAGVGLSALGAGVAAAAPAPATSTIYTLATSGFCAGSITAGVGNYPGQADIGFSGNLIGVGPCSITVDFVFRGRADGHVSTFTRTSRGPGFVGNPGRDIVSPGKEGVYDVTITPRGQHVGSQKAVIDTTYRP